MKTKFFRVNYESDEEIDENEVDMALNSWFDMHYDTRNPPVEEIKAYEIDKRIFEWEEEKPKKIEKLPLLEIVEVFLKNIEKLNSNERKTILRVIQRASEPAIEVVNRL
jgi:hypothetical protein